MNISNKEEYGGLVVNYARLQARYWADAGFQSRLSSDVVGSLKEFDLDFGDKVEVEIIVNTPDVAYFVISERPAGLSDAFVDQMAASGTFGTALTVGSAGSVCSCLGTFGTLGTIGCHEL